MADEGFVDWRGGPINKKRHGGFRAALFIYYLNTVLTAPFLANAFNLVTYLSDTMHMDVARSSTISTNYISASRGFSLLGAFLADSYIGQIKTILIFAPLEILGFGLLALQAHLPSLHPSYCDTYGQWSHCEEVGGFKLVLLNIGIYAVALAEGCLRGCVAAIGGDQFDREDPVEARLRSSFFNWFTFSVSIGIILGLILIVWIEGNKGWDYGFGVSAILLLTGLLVLIGGLPFYRNRRPSGSPLTRMLQVVVAAFKKRHVAVNGRIELEQRKDEEMLSHTKGLKFLDKASIDNGNSGAWSQCTTTQVEETKIVIRMIPIILSSVLNYIPNSLLITLTVQQGNTMNNKLGNIHISSASLYVIPTIFQIFFIIAYDRLFVPLARRITSHPGGITPLQRVGVGYVCMTTASGVAAVIERKRLKNIAGIGVPMSVFWLAWQFLILGICDVTSFTGLLEFFNGEVSEGMKSLGTAILWCTLALSSWMGGFLIQAVNRLTRNIDGEGTTGWLEGSTLNNSHLDRFYWLLFALGCVGFFIYLWCAWIYTYRPRIATNSEEKQVC